MDEKDKELTIEFTDEVKAKLDADPKMAAAVRDLLAAIHQAHHAVQAGQHKTMEDALEAITGFRPVAIDPDDPEITDEEWEAVAKWRRECS